MYDGPGTGCVKWPRVGRNFHHTTGDGMWVTAFYRTAFAPAQLDLVLEKSGTAAARRLVDSFIRCHGPGETVALPLPDCVVSPDAERIYPASISPVEVGPSGPASGRIEWLRFVLDAGVPVLAAVNLGSTHQVFAHTDTNDYWHASVKDLTWSGRRLLRNLAQLYGRRPHLLTYISAEPVPM